MPKNYDFSGWATKANMLCSDGRTIMKNAFKDSCNITSTARDTQNKNNNYMNS